MLLHVLHCTATASSRIWNLTIIFYQWKRLKGGFCCVGNIYIFTDEQYWFDWWFFLLECSFHVRVHRKQCNINRKIWRVSGNFVDIIFLWFIWFDLMENKVWNIIMQKLLHTLSQVSVCFMYVTVIVICRWHWQMSKGQIWNIVSSLKYMRWVLYERSYG